MAVVFFSIGRTRVFLALGVEASIQTVWGKFIRYQLVFFCFVSNSRIFDPPLRFLDVIADML